MTYQEFLKTKELKTIKAGFDVSDEWLSDKLFDFQRDIVRWALQKGKAAIFSDCGTGKTIMQLEWAYRIHEHTGKDVLVIAPLAVTEQTKKEGAKFGIPVNVCRTQEDVEEGINITNYEMLEHFEADSFVGVVLDESSILKSFTSSTRNELIDRFQMTPYKLACTATPSPNDHSELGNHAEFLGIMTRTEMLNAFIPDRKTHRTDARRKEEKKDRREYLRQYRKEHAEEIRKYQAEYIKKRRAVKIPDISAWKVWGIGFYMNLDTREKVMECPI